VLAELPLVIPTPRLELRPIDDRDVEALWPYASDPEFPRFMSWDAHHDRDSLRAWIATCGRALVDGRSVNWVLVHDGKAAGCVGLEGVTWQRGAWRLDRAELGYWLATPHWNKGLMTEAALAATAWGFETLKLHKVTVGCVEDNVASRRVIEKLGFRFMGREEEHFWRHGRWWGHLRYELTATEWADSARTSRFSRPSRPTVGQ
jgi:ribosomal-protein-alanine N-acetyltransferase